MKHSLLLVGCLVAAVGTSTVRTQDQAIRVPLDHQLSPDGQTIVFVHENDIWSVDAAGGTAQRLTLHPARDRRPIVSPDGNEIAFMSSRAGGSQIFVMPIDGGAPEQITFDSESKRLLAYGPDGSFLVQRRTDRAPFGTESGRLVLLYRDIDRAEQVLFDAGANLGSLSPDGTKALFTRGRTPAERKGYHTAAADQIWLADLSADEPKITRLSEDQPGFQNISERNPLWSPDGDGYYFTSEKSGVFDLWYRDLDGSGERQITDLADSFESDDGVRAASMSADGGRVLFRRGFDLYLHETRSGKTSKVDLRASGDSVAAALQRRKLSGASTIAFTADGKQMAFVAGHDIYVMDRVLKEPRRVTSSTSIESSLTFSPDGKRLVFVSEAGGEVDVWEVSCPREDGIWWLGEEFTPVQRTDDPAVEAGIAFSPDGERVAFTKDSDLMIAAADFTASQRMVETWNPPAFDWSPDSKWLTWSVQDDEFNSEIFIAPIDGSRQPFNVSRHPDNDRGPVWSGDGTRIAWTARREGEESDIYYVELAKSEAESTERDRKLEEAMKAMKKKGGKGKAAKSSKPGAGEKPDAAKAEVAKTEGDEDAKKTGPKDEVADVVIDFDGIFDRVERISIADSRESGLVWSPDGKKLGFQASVDGKSGFYTVEFPDEVKPKRVADRGLMAARWIKEGDQLVGLRAPGGSGGGRAAAFARFRSGGFSMTPASMNAKSGKTESFGFSAFEERDWSEIRGLAFDQGWRAMRDRFYDGNLNNLNWNGIRERYRPVATELLGQDQFSLVMNMMLGELNASHMGHRGGSEPLPAAPSVDWAPRTMHLGLRFADRDAGPGKLVTSVIPGGPTSQARSLVEAGERITAVDGEELSPERSILPLLTMAEARDLELQVTGRDGATRTVTVRPVSSGSMRGQIYEEWVEGNRSVVEAMSGGRLGYLHIQGMNMPSFRQFEEDLYHAGAGKDGLIIDVRFNGGGSTADHVLTALTQPVHAVTIPRGGGEGYPQDRKIYASWSKPIVLMCNEHSFSNAEILSHAVKTVGRGRVVGMRTAGGVISTGSQSLLDGSTVRMPFRGWYVSADGRDMELNGCLPDIALWNAPDGPDVQLRTAVEALTEDVERAGPGPDLVPASLRGQGK